MNKPTVRIYQGNGDFIDREMNDEELAQYKIDQAEYLARKAEATEKENAKAALLTKLGISEDEAKLLLS